MSRRRLLALLGLGVVFHARRAAAAPTQLSYTPKVLFVCQFGSVEGAVGRELFRRRAAERGIKALASSRGLAPEEHVPLQLARALKAERIDPSAEPLRKLQPADVEEADVIVLFGRPPPGLGLEIARDWSDLGSLVDDYPTTKADLEKRIDELLDEVAGMKIVRIQIIGATDPH